MVSLNTQHGRSGGVSVHSFRIPSVIELGYSNFFLLLKRASLLMIDHFMVLTRRSMRTAH